MRFGLDIPLNVGVMMVTETLTLVKSLKHQWASREHLGAFLDGLIFKWRFQIELAHVEYCSKSGVYNRKDRSFMHHVRCVWLLQMYMKMLLLCQLVDIHFFTQL